MDKLKKNYYNIKKEDFAEKSSYWLERAERMAQRRSYFEEIWRDNLFQFIINPTGLDGFKRQFNPNEAVEVQNYYAANYRSGFKFSNIKFPLEFSVVTRKLATEIKNMPQADWMVKDDDDQSPGLLFKSVYEDILDQEVGVEYQEVELLLNKNVFGTAPVWSRLISYEHQVKEPVINEDGEVTFEEKTVKVREFASDVMDLRHVLIDEGCKRPDLKDCEDCIIFEYYSEDKAKKVFSDVDFEELGLKAVPPTHCFQDVNGRNGGDNKPVFEVMHCYNELLDEYTIMINGKCIRTSPIVARVCNGKKELPLTFFIGHKVPGQPYGASDPSLVKPFRQIKNRNRNIIHDVTTKTAKPTLVIDENATFDEENYYWGQDFIRANPDMVKPLNIVANLQPALDLDERTDGDVTMVTGININDTTSPPSDETATKTVVRKESQVAIIDLGLRINLACGFKRWHRINANIILPHLLSPKLGKDGDTKRKVVTRDKQLFNVQSEDVRKKVGRYTVEEKPGTYIFQYKGEDLDYDFVPILKMGNIVISDQLEKNLALEGLEALVRLAPEVVDQAYIGKEIVRIFNFKDEALKVQEKPMSGKVESEEDMVNKMIEQAGGVIPENQKLINQFKNAKQDQSVVENAARPTNMAEGGEGASLPSSRGIPAG